MNTTARMNHIFNPDGKTFIMAMDHAANFNTLPALNDPKKLVREIAAAGADAFLSTVGMAEYLTDSFLGKGIIVRADGGVSFLGDKSVSYTHLSFYIIRIYCFNDVRKERLLLNFSFFLVFLVSLYYLSLIHI